MYTTRLLLGSRLACLAGFAFCASFATNTAAGTFSGVYRLETTLGFDLGRASGETGMSDVRLSGFVELADVPVGTTKFALDDPFVVDFEFVASGTSASGVELVPVVADQLDDSGVLIPGKTAVQFDLPVGSSVLTPSPVREDPFGTWSAIGFGIEGAAAGGVTLGHWRFTNDDVDLLGVSWDMRSEQFPPIAFLAFFDATAPGEVPAAWRLVLVPEPTTVAVTLHALLLFAMQTLRRRTQ